MILQSPSTHVFVAAYNNSQIDLALLTLIARHIISVDPQDRYLQYVYEE